MTELTPQVLAKLNQFTRRLHTADEVYVFDVVLCDNEVDRDLERFSEAALQRLKTLFVGKTGIFDHNPSGKHQTARIFETELEAIPGKQTTLGEPYLCLKGRAYMVRTEGNQDLIREIDGGIKKEVSVSCTAAAKYCSVCGKNLRKETCLHSKGRLYQGKLCHTILDEITDAYEWSFVAVPAQRQAGVTKKYTGEPATDTEGLTLLQMQLAQQAELLAVAEEEVRKEIVKLCYLTGQTVQKTVMQAAEGMTLKELFGLRKELQAELPHHAEPQLAPRHSATPAEELSAFCT